MKEVITTKYIAFDGKEFSDSKKCAAYEDKCKAKQVYADVLDEYGVKLNNVVEDISKLCTTFKSKSDREFACKHCPLRKEDRDFGGTICLLDHYDFG
jgi:hypothetical protein